MIRLHMNECGLEHHPAVLEASQKVVSEDLRYYYYGNYHEKLVQKLSQYANLPEENLMIGNGSTDFLRLLIGMFLDQGEEVATLTPTYLDCQTFIRQAKGIIAEVKFDPRVVPAEGTKHLLLEKAINSKTKIIFICTPNNPASLIWTEKEVEQICMRHADKLVIVDQAYYEFQDQPDQILSWAGTTFKNLVVLRTFSKGFALAGMRLGYMGVSSEIIKEIQVGYRAKQVNNLVAKLGLVALQHADYYLQQVQKIRQIRDWSIKAINQIGSKNGLIGYLALPSQTNHFLVYVGNRAAELLEYLAQEKGILLREMENDHGLLGYVRVSVGNQSEMEILVKAMTEFIG